MIRFHGESSDDSPIGGMDSQQEQTGLNYNDADFMGYEDDAVQGQQQFYMQQMEEESSEEEHRQNVYSHNRYDEGSDDSEESESERSFRHEMVGEYVQPTISKPRPKFPEMPPQADMEKPFLLYLDSLNRVN